MRDRTGRILIIDDDQKLLERMKGILAGEGCEIVLADSGQKGLGFLARESFDLVLADMMLPEISGYDILDYIRHNCPDTLPIVVTGYASLESVIKAMRNGAYDYVTKPFRPEIIKLAVKRALEKRELQYQLAEATQKLQILAITDETTMLYNIRYFNERLAVEFARAQRYHLPLSCIMLDVDIFKNINDLYGHLKGDEVLRFLADIIRISIRTSDLAARYGGDEFCILLPQTPEDEAYHMAHRIWDKVNRTDFTPILPQTPKVSLSLGIATFPHPMVEAPRELLKLADDALYMAKGDGRDRIKVYSQKGLSKCKESALTSAPMPKVKN